MRTNLQAIILAAGQSKRFNTNKNKVLEKICGQEMILYPTKLLENMHIPTTVVVGYQKDTVTEIVKRYHEDRIHFVIQEEQQGTAHAIMCARDSWQEEHILIINADMPLITQKIIENLYQEHIKTEAAISFVISHVIDPSSGTYGRVVKKGNQIEIIEAQEFSDDTNEYCCINAGAYIVTKQFLAENIDEIKCNKASKEFYVTDLVKIASKKKQTVTTTPVPFDRIRGINTFQELWAAEQVKRSELIKYWMEHGVRFAVAQNVHIDLDVIIGSGTFIGCGAHLEGKTTIGKNCHISEFTSLEDATIADNVIIHPYTYIKNARVDNNAQVGPFAHIHTNTHIAQHATVGNFVEIKNSYIGNHSKAKHLTYLGDTHVGKKANIGAGTVTCNYDGKQKHKTTIEDNAFIGTNNALVAPVTIHKGAYTAAGSAITENVPADALAIARARQVNKPDYAKKLRDQTTSDKQQTSKDDDKSLSFIGAVKTTNDEQQTK